MSLWSYANPQGKQPAKELCDVLIVCDPDIAIVSVKAPTLTDTGQPRTDWRRWQRRAITSSCEQIHGAERWLKGARMVIRHDGSPGLPLPPTSERRIHRVAVALGSQGKVPIQFGDFGKGFVHVFDEASLMIILTELDTVTDFVSYLSAKEALYRNGTETMFAGGEEDLLAYYLHNGCLFPPGPTRIMVPDTVWQEFSSKSEYKAKKAADRGSYAWDGLINGVAQDLMAGNLEFGPSLTESEIGLRAMAKESRFARRVLAKAFKEFLDQSHQAGSRMLISPSGVVYVFVATPHGTNRRFRSAELGNRCFVARGLNQGHAEVVGIATEQYERGRGFSIDLCYLKKETWTAADQDHMERMQKDLGYFTAPRTSEVSEDEYPRG